MSGFIPFDRSQPYFLPPDLKSWLPADDVAHFIVAAVERGNCSRGWLFWC
ncbi:hypothetical protein AA12717_4027 [Gluconacetobacter sacchari DSM 12717]|uniref:Transposase n=1 Tax=Gluconacetobacter sacchari DSM 12717 TaxID=1307940 RepID=A0ABQ0PD52_9PROT|nr:hypothetical protein [Gluconacetobacter sacchari]GBQ32705.1 hypothetical protein AA12717_4027 [Gluconacetobacter sacchari DSM 12717]